jgi:acetyltransferase-like isoleucine patch superfamily enzyme
MVEDGAFIGSGVLFATDLNPRSQTVIGGLKKREDWILSPILVGQGVSVGSGAVILGGVKIGKFSLIGAGSIVTKDVCEHGLVRGNPAKLAGFVCQCGYKGILVELTKDDALLKCSHCQIRFSIKRTFWDNVRKNLLLKNE